MICAQFQLEPISLTGVIASRVPTQDTKISVAPTAMGRVELITPVVEDNMINIAEVMIHLSDRDEIVNRNLGQDTGVT